jgi:hypothetical protein
MDGTARRGAGPGGTALEPDDPAVRLVRARSDSQLPLMAGREGNATADFDLLVGLVRADPASGDLDGALHREIFFHAAAFALRQRKPERAVSLLTEAAKVTAVSPSDDEVQSMLALARRELSSQDHAESVIPPEGRPAAP